MAEQPVKEPQEGTDRATGKKKAYNTPRLTVYGDLRRLTAGGTRQRDEAGVVGGPSTHR